MAAVARALSVPTVASEEAKVLYEHLPGRIAANDRRNAVASVVLLRLDGNVWLARMRKDGFFRASRYGFEGAVPPDVVFAPSLMW